MHRAVTSHQGAPGQEIVGGPLKAAWINGSKLGFGGAFRLDNA